MHMAPHIFYLTIGVLVGFGYVLFITGGPNKHGTMRLPVPPEQLVGSILLCMFFWPMVLPTLFDWRE
jgi:hypothetical protein